MAGGDPDAGISRYYPGMTGPGRWQFAAEEIKLTSMLLAGVPQGMLLPVGLIHFMPGATLSRNRGLSLLDVVNSPQ